MTLLTKSVSLWCLAAAAASAAPDIRTEFYAAGFARDSASLNWLSVDSLGGGKVDGNPVMAEASSNAVFQADGKDRFRYRAPGSADQTAWRISGSGKILTLRSEWHAGAAPIPLTLNFNQKSNHATVLGFMKPGERRVSTPCVLHLPDLGSMRIACNVKEWALDYDARRYVPKPFVRVAFPPADQAHPRVEYTLAVTAIYPALKGVEKDPLFDGYRRNYLNIFQMNPRMQMLANNSSSDIVPFSVHAYADVARKAPPLAEGLTCLDLVRITLDRYLAGVKGYGQPGYGVPKGDADLVPWVTPFTSADTYPSLVIAACVCIEDGPDWAWARTNYSKLRAWIEETMATDKDGNGLIEYPASGNYGDRPRAERRPANWWDTINFGHEDAYANALAYRACRMFATVATKLGHTADADLYTARADKLREAYARAFRDPATGVLAGWKSADGQLHDYWFTFVNGVAVTTGLLGKTEADAVMGRMVRKLTEVGFTNFSLGLPGNLVPVRKGDYVFHNGPPERHGEPRLEDGSDGFQYYENGGATGCYAYYTIKALYDLGRVGDARRILFPMLEGYRRGEFQGFCDTGMSRDWRDWRGGCHGYEGLLVENYQPLLAVLDEWAARK